MKNLVKRKLKAGKPALGTWVSIGHPDVTRARDWLVCDMEHSPYGPETYHFIVLSLPKMS